MDELVGKSFGSYTVVERIGEGGMAVVYKGYQPSLSRYVAIKVLRGSLARDQEFVARFRREALAVAKLSHPNILHVYDTGTAHGAYYIAMDYAEGGTLKDLLQRGPLPIERAVALVAQLADALDYAHRQGLVHRDVKPSNVLLTRDGRPLLADFGIARVLHQTSQLTRTGTSIGTPEYMAPEQAEGKSPDGRADIYALGIVLYEMLTGLVPFRADTPVATLYKHVHDPLPPLRRANNNVPGWLEEVVDKALAKRPEDRYRRGSEFAAALRQRHAPIVAKKQRQTPSPQARGTAIPSPPPTRRVAQDRPSSQQRSRQRRSKQRRSKMPAILLGAIAVLCLVIFVGAAALIFSGEGRDGTRSQVVTKVVTQQVSTVVVTAPPVEKPTSPPPTQTREPIATIAPPQSPTPPRDPVATWHISSLQADISGLRFFESGYKQTPREEREYGNQFAKSETRYIYYELNIEYPKHKQDMDFSVAIIYYGPDGAVFSEFSANHSIEADWTSSWHTKGWGWDDPGEWDTGMYLAELYVEGELIASDFFEIYE